jgi:hypothetical protein
MEMMNRDIFNKGTHGRPRKGWKDSDRSKLGNMKSSEG